MIAGLSHSSLSSTATFCNCSRSFLNNNPQDEKSFQTYGNTFCGVAGVFIAYVVILEFLRPSSLYYELYSFYNYLHVLLSSS